MGRALRVGAGITLAASAATALAVHVATRSHAITAVASTPATSKSTALRGMAPGPGYCDVQRASPLGIVGHLSPGHSASELTAEGYRAWPVVASSPGALASTPGGLVLIRPADPRGTVDVNRLRSDPALSAAGDVYPMSADPSLTSCDYQLTDRPAARPILDAAERAMVARGLITPAQTGCPDVCMISDDPTDSRRLIVTLVIPGHRILNQPVPPDVHLYANQAVVAVVERDGDRVVMAGYGPWYNDQ